METLSQPDPRGDLSGRVHDRVGRRVKAGLVSSKDLALPILAPAEQRCEEYALVLKRPFHSHRGLAYSEDAFIHH